MENKSKDFSYNQAINLICNQLQALGITTDISCRIKDPYSILQKLTRKSVKIEELTDIVGFRIIVREEDECYTTLKLIQEIYKVIPEKYRDYIDNPKTNGGLVEEHPKVSFYFFIPINPSVLVHYLN